jgi:hypothetical protein
MVLQPGPAELALTRLTVMGTGGVGVTELIPTPLARTAEEEQVLPVLHHNPVFRRMWDITPTHSGTGETVDSFLAVTALHHYLDVQAAHVSISFQVVGS